MNEERSHQFCRTAWRGTGAAGGQAAVQRPNASMTAPAPHLRRWLQSLRGTPLHPQWLLDGNAQTRDWVRQHARGRVLDLAARTVDDRIFRTLRLHRLAPGTGGLIYGRCRHFASESIALASQRRYRPLMEYWTSSPCRNIPGQPRLCVSCAPVGSYCLPCPSCLRCTMRRT